MVAGGVVVEWRGRAVGQPWVWGVEVVGMAAGLLESFAGVL